jgi:hypothetical protein
MSAKPLPVFHQENITKATISPGKGQRVKFDTTSAQIL